MENVASMTKKGKNFLVRKNHVPMFKYGKTLLIWKYKVTLIKKAHVSNLVQLQIHPSPLIQQSTSFSYQCTISTTKTHD